jgi:hypothetical protein
MGLYELPYGPMLNTTEMVMKIFKEQYLDGIIKEKDRT